MIVARGAEREAIQRLEGLVAGELNVKELEFVSEEAELVHYDVKPNYRSLGPRFGKLMPQAAAAIEALDPAAVSDAIAGSRRLGINVDGAEHELQPEDMALVMRPLDGYQVEAEAGRAVALALELDDELLREGLAREIVHAVQNARRDAGLEVTDRIGLVARRRPRAAGRRPRPRGLRRGRDARDHGRLRRGGGGRRSPDRRPRPAHRAGARGVAEEPSLQRDAQVAAVDLGHGARTCRRS